METRLSQVTVTGPALAEHLIEISIMFVSLLFFFLVRYSFLCIRNCNLFSKLIHKQFRFQFASPSHPFKKKKSPLTPNKEDTVKLFKALNNQKWAN